MHGRRVAPDDRAVGPRGEHLQELFYVVLVCLQALIYIGGAEQVPQSRVHIILILHFLLIKYAQPTGDTIKATYIIQLFHLLGILDQYL